MGDKAIPGTKIDHIWIEEAREIPEPTGWHGCHMCNGTGVDSKNSNVMKTIECPRCIGRGRIPVYGD